MYDKYKATTTAEIITKDTEKSHKSSRELEPPWIENESTEGEENKILKDVHKYIKIKSIKNTY